MSMAADLDADRTAGRRRASGRRDAGIPASIALRHLRAGRLGLARAAAADRAGRRCRAQQRAELWRQLGVPLVGDRAVPRCLGVARAQGQDQPRRAARARCRSGSRRRICGPITSPSAPRQPRSTSARRSATRTSLAEGPAGRGQSRAPTPASRPIIDQIFTSLKTVFTGFLLATLIAVPLGILCGLSRIFNAALNPLIQIFKPVSPLAWLPIVTMVVSALYVIRRSACPKVVPDLGDHRDAVLAVADADQHRARRRLDRQGPAQRRPRAAAAPGAPRSRKIVLPSSLPLIFTGLRLSLGVGWMVLIAAEMLAQNPGLGKFVWDEFQNGSSAVARQDHGRGVHHRHHRLPARSHDARAAGRLHLLSATR